MTDLVDQTFVTAKSLLYSEIALQQLKLAKVLLLEQICFDSKLFPLVTIVFHIQFLSAAESLLWP